MFLIFPYNSMLQELQFKQEFSRSFTMKNRIISAIVILGYVFLFIILTMPDHIHADRANDEMHQMVHQAIIKTAGSCVSHPIRLVQPPKGSTEHAVLIIGGYDVSAEDLQDLVIYARPNGDVYIGIAPESPEEKEITILRHAHCPH
jgi:hypothetical protein